MTIEKRANGKYRITQMVDGKRYRLTLDHKPTKREAEEVMQELIRAAPDPSARDLTFRAAFDEFMEVKHNVLSPATRRTYNTHMRRLSDSFASMSIRDIDQISIQSEINRLTPKLAPKSVYAVHGFISTVIKMYRPDLNLHTKLPQKIRSDFYLPSQEEVKQIIEDSKGTKYYVPFVLGLCGLRRSEICAITGDDVDGNALTIDKALIDGDEGLVLYHNKTTNSKRTIYLPQNVADYIKKNGWAYPNSPDTLRRHIHKVQKKYGIPSFRLHDLRAYFASFSHMLGIPDQLIQEAGGWKTDYTMKRVYRKTMQEEYKKSQKNYLDNISDML